MILVTISNVNATFSGVFDTEDLDQATSLAIENMLDEHEFGDDNFIPTPDDVETDLECAQGFLIYDGEDIYDRAAHPETYWVQAKTVGFGRMHGVEKYYGQEQDH